MNKYPWIIAWLAANLTFGLGLLFLIGPNGALAQLDIDTPIAAMIGVFWAIVAIALWYDIRDFYLRKKGNSKSM